MTGLAAGYGDASRAFLILPLSAIAYVRGSFAAAIRNIKRPEAHKRFMLLATISLLQAAMGRIFFVLVIGGGPGLRPGLGPPPPLFIGIVPSLILEFMIVAGIVYDWRTRGRPHRVWLIGAVVMTAVILLRGPFAGTRAWLAFADALGAHRRLRSKGVVAAAKPPGVVGCLKNIPHIRSVFGGNKNDVVQKVIDRVDVWTQFRVPARSRVR